jgi:hypothetical protein
MNIIEYAREIRQASQDGDTNKIKELETLKGNENATVKDVEELNANMVSLIVSLISQETLINSYKLDLIITALTEKEIFSAEDIDELNKSLEELIDYTKGENNDK